MKVWGLLAVCAVLIVGAMAWLTGNVLEAERERSLAESRARLEEKIRLSLWRMDAVASALVIEENQRVLMPGAEGVESPVVLLRFRIGPDGRAVSVDRESPEDLTMVNGLLAGNGSAFSTACAAVGYNNQWQANRAIAAGAKSAAEGEPVIAYQQAANPNDRAARAWAVNNAVSSAGLAQKVVVQPQAEFALSVGTGGFQPLWFEEEPFLLRQVASGGMVTAIEGVWLDREVFRTSLLGEISDLLPAADLEPEIAGESQVAAMGLASFPWRLVPGETAVAAAVPRSAVVASLGAGWVAVGIALVAGLGLVTGIMALSERRASFVSAVTHELRTPLTTFRLYSDMLESGAVRDEGKRAVYFRTMRREADRLSHLVENVLAFSRIERKGGKPRVVEVPMRSLVEGMRERLEERLAGADLRLVTRIEGEPVARADAAAVEHVVFNLVDNAAKYAAGSSPAEVEVSVVVSGDKVELAVADHGPGIPESDHGRVFRAFHKSAAEAAGTKPGVGLGLALSRRLARDMSGELECRGGDGARFVLVLPAAVTSG